MSTHAYAVSAVCVTIFSTGGKFQPVSNSTELHALTPAACSYALLVILLPSMYIHFFFYLTFGISLIPPPP